jgi:hypothetical protein
MTAVVAVDRSRRSQQKSNLSIAYMPLSSEEDEFLKN